MKISEGSCGIDALLLSFFEKAPVLSRYAKTRGWYYVVSWLQRITGIGLVIALIIHLFTLPSSQSPGFVPVPINIPAGLIFVVLALALSLVAGFHALNGGRLILYELFGKRNDAALIRGTFLLTIAYAALCGFSLATSNRGVPAMLFWLAISPAGIVMACVVAARIGRSRHSLLWKLQRISGAFLFLTVPAYLLFAYLTPGVAAAWAALAPLQNLFIRIAILAPAVSALYHAGYGLFSIAADYLGAGAARAVIAACIVVVIGLMAFRAFGLIVFR